MPDVPLLKVAVTSEGPTLLDALDPRFGRAGGLVVTDLATGGSHYLDNGAAQILAEGAGIQAAENLVKAGAQVLITGYVGPKALTALHAAGVKVAQGLEGITVGEALDRYRAGHLSFTSSEGGKR